MKKKATGRCSVRTERGRARHAAPSSPNTRKPTPVPFPSPAEVEAEELNDLHDAIGAGFDVGGVDDPPADDGWDVGEDVVIDRRPLSESVGLMNHWTPPRRPGPQWDCPYGCPGIVPLWDGDELAAHTWDCPYWTHEGKDETPFDLPSDQARKRNTQLPR